MPSIGLIIIVLTIIVNLFLGLFTYFKNKNSDTNKLFFLFILTLISYTFFNYLSLNQTNPISVLFWIRIVMGIAALINVVFYLLIVTFPQQRVPISNFKLIIFGAVTWTLALITQTNLVFKDVKIIGNNTEAVPGIGMVFFLLHTIYFLGGGFVILFMKYRKAYGIEKIQLKFFLGGTLFMLGSIIITNLLFVIVLHTSAFVGLLPIYILIFISFVSYSIIKHRFLDIHFIVARSIAYTILLLMFAFIYVAGLLIVGIYITREPVPTSNLVGSVLFALILIFSFQPIRKFLEKITAQIFYRQMYNSQTLLWNISRIMAATYSISELSEAVLTEMTKEMNISGASLILTREHKIIWSKAVGDKKKVEYNEKELTHVLTTIMKTSTEHILIFDEMYESPEKKVMRNNDIAALLVLTVQSEVIGAILLSEKSSGDIYSLEDISILKIMSPEISIAVKNALSYDEIKQFNNTLQQEVSKATDEVKNANEQMYLRNLELAERNKTLSLLRKIDDAILTTVTDTKQIAQRVADMIVYESRIKGLLIVLNDPEEQRLVELATAPAAIMNNIDIMFKRDMRGVNISLREKNNLIVAAIQAKTMKISPRLYDAVRPLFTQEEADRLEDLIGAKSHVIYPMIVHGVVIGAIVMGIDDAYEKISEYQRDLMSRLVSVMGIAIDNAMLYQKIQEANERLRQLDLLKDEFVSVASHELRTPMTAIKSYLWLALAGKGGPLTEKLKFYIDRSFTSTIRLIKLVNDMLNVSRIEAGRMSFDIQKIDILKLVDDTISEVKPRADELGIAVEVDTQSQSAMPAVLADTDKIKEVVINLIGNSLKFTPKGGKITLHFEKKADFLITHVTDTGEGMDEEDIPKLFQKFSLIQGSYQTNKQSSQGTGLGLYICKAIMKEHGGDIWAHSKGHGTGATFSFSLKIFNDADFQYFQQQAKKDGLGIIHSEL